MTVLLLLHYSGSRVMTDIQAAGANPYQKRVLISLKEDSIGVEPVPMVSKVISKAIPTSAKPKQRCMKQFNVSFLKVHKAGSTTVMNIFLRFAIQHGLNIVLPRKSSGFGFNYLGYGKTVERNNIVPLPVNETYNILCNHVVYNKAAFRSIMPNDTKYVGILREPVSHFKSAVAYFGFYNALLKYSQTKKLNITGSVLTEFLNHPEKFQMGGIYYVHNKMSYDLGLPSEKFTDENFIQSYIKELNKDYELMLLMEQFEESLVLMKRLLCWDIKDILYVPLNVRRAKQEMPFTDEDRARLKIWNKADFELYDLFKREFNAKLVAQGDDFDAEVQLYKDVRKQVENYCYKLKNSPIDTPPIYFIKKSKFYDAFQVTKGDCKLMMEPELSMMKRLIEEAWTTYNSSKH